MMEPIKPRVYGDRLMPLIIKVDSELTEEEQVYIERTDVFYREDDLQNIARLQNHLKEIYNDLYTDRIRGDSALDLLKYKLFNKDPYEDLIFRMMDSGSFPEMKTLYRFCEEN